MARSRPAASFQAELPPTPDYRDHRTFVVPPLTAPGFYLIVASAREDFSPKDNQLAALFFQRSDLVVSVRDEDAGAEVMVQSGASGEPIAGAEVLLYARNWNTRHKLVANLRTDAGGAVRLPVRYESHLLIVRYQDQLTVDPDDLYLGRDRTVYESRKRFHLYRPQRLSALADDPLEGGPLGGNAAKLNWRTLPNTKIKVILYDANHELS